jgi:hypothetical protein
MPTDVAESVGAAKTVVELLTLPVRKAWAWWKAPKFSISFNAAEEPVQARVQNAGHQPAWFYRLDVRNTGRSIARDCVATLVTVEPVQPCYAAPGQRLARPCILNWAHSAIQFQPVSIDPKDGPRKLDLFFIFCADPRLFFDVEMPQTPQGFTNVFGPGEYIAKVRVTANGGEQKETLRASM